MFAIQTSITLAIIPFLLFQLISTNKCPQNCIQCLVTSFCTQCDTSYSISNGQCHVSSQKINIIHAGQNISKYMSKRMLKQEEIGKVNNDIDDEKSGKYNIVEIQIIRIGSPGLMIQYPCAISTQQNPQICILCNNGYQMTEQGQCILQFIQCQQFQNTNNKLLCEKCNQKFVNVNGQCIDHGCSLVNGLINYYHCNKCQYGYSLNRYRHCDVNQCVKYQSGICISCNTGFILINSTCEKQIKNCAKQYNQSCLQCNTKYYSVALNDSKNGCLPIPANCNLFSAEKRVCLACVSVTERPLNGICVDANCLSVQKLVNNNNGDANSQIVAYECSACAIGYQITQNHKCVPTFNDTNCVKVIMNGCALCKDGYYVNTALQNKCIKIPDHCIDSSCRYCQAGYISNANQNKCVALQNCNKYSGNMCLICMKGYSLSLFGTCIKTVQNCLQYSLTQCSKCAANYQKVKKTQNTTNSVYCILNNSFIDSNCQSKNLDQKCILCKATFRLQPKYNNLCVTSSGRCKTSGKSGQCLTCYEGYKLNQFIGDCVRSALVANCANQTQDICNKCASRYYLINGQTCKQVDPLCKDYEKDLGYCLSCYQGYILFNNLCEPLSAHLLTQTQLNSINNLDSTTQSSTFNSNCLSISTKDPSKCTSCYSSFYLNKNTSTCIKVDGNCKTYNNETGACLSCYDGYVIDNSSRCITQTGFQDNGLISTLTLTSSLSYTLYCKKIDEINNQCLQCIDRYVKINKICKQVSNLCKTFNNITGACTSCYSGYIISNNNCIQSLANSQQDDTTCLKYSNSGNRQCINCVDGYFLSTKTIKCIKAALGIDQLCAQYNDDGYCITCMKGHQINNSVCV